MNEPLDSLKNIRRPRLLIRSARIGVDSYNRQRHLARLLGPGNLPASQEVLKYLMNLEADLNVERKLGRASYTVARHVDILIAIMGEARLLHSMQCAPGQSIRATAAEIAAH